MDKYRLKKKWLTYAVVGFLIMGLGVSMIGDAIVMKMGGNGLWGWFLYGSLALATFFAGLSVFGQAVVFKTLIALSKKKNKSS